MGELTADNPVATDALADGSSSGGLGNGHSDADERDASDPAADGTPDDAAVAAVRGFNRFYTNVIGLLRGKYLDTPVLAHRGQTALRVGAAEHQRGDRPAGARSTSTPGYLSRILARFESHGLICQAPLGRGRAPPGHPADRQWPRRRGGTGREVRPARPATC